MKSATKTALIGGIFSVIASVFGAVFTGIIPIGLEPASTEPAQMQAEISPLIGTRIAGEDVIFSGADSVARQGSEIVKYHWNFGDGSSDTGSTSVHRYKENGTYRVTLTVTDEDGRTKQDTAVLEVMNSAEPATPQGIEDAEETDPANLISISAIKPRQLTYFVNQTAELDFTITDEQNIPYNFTAYFILNNETQITTSNSYEFTHSPTIWADVYAAGIWQVKVVVEWKYQEEVYEKERNVFFRVQESP